MEISSKPKKELRSKVGGIATSIAFVLAIGVVSVGLARADDDNYHGHRGHGYRHNSYRVYSRPNVYYAPQPDYYYAPQPEYNPPPPGIRLFFGY